jgi:type II secretory pathway pseudopilin PulG
MPMGQKARRKSPRRRTRNGKPDTDWVIQRNPDGTEKDKIVYGNGSYNERERRSDGTTFEDRYSAETKSHTYQKSDARGNLIEVVEKSDSYYIRCTYSFDKEGRPTGQINYDAAGNVLEKSTLEYRDDPHGNWIQKKTIVWDTKSDPMQPKMVGISLRTINYY